MEERKWFCEEYERIVDEPIRDTDLVDAAVLMLKSEVMPPLTGLTCCYEGKRVGHL